MKRPLKELLPCPWQVLLKETLERTSFTELGSFLEEERRTHTVFPPEEDLFSAFRLTLPEQIRVVILGQDPYHEKGQAHGLAFSVRKGVPLPPSLRNIFREYTSDLGFPAPADGSLIPWAERGVLLLNTVLTVRSGEANSHRKHGWEDFTDSVIRAADALPQPVVFVLWGNPAQTKIPLIRHNAERILCSVHPSPLSASRGFFGSRPFSKANALLEKAGSTPVDWRLPAEDLPLFS